jgi:hypothetical protein
VQIWSHTLLFHLCVGNFRPVPWTYRFFSDLTCLIRNERVSRGSTTVHIRFEAWERLKRVQGSQENLKNYQQMLCILKYTAAIDLRCSPCAIHGGLSGNGKGVSPSALVFCSELSSHQSWKIISHRELAQQPHSVCSTKGLSLTPQQHCCAPSLVDMASRMSQGLNPAPPIRSRNSPSSCVRFRGTRYPPTTCCFVWVWNLVSHTEGGTKTEGVRE